MNNTKFENFNLKFKLYFLNFNRVPIQSFEKKQNYKLKYEIDFPLYFFVSCFQAL